MQKKIADEEGVFGKKGQNGEEAVNIVGMTISLIVTLSIMAESREEREGEMVE